MICGNLKEVEAKIEAACKRAGRDRSEVTADRSQQDKTG